MSETESTQSATVRPNEPVPPTENNAPAISFDLHELDQLRGAAITAGIDPSEGPAVAKWLTFLEAAAFAAGECPANTVAIARMVDIRVVGETVQAGSVTPLMLALRGVALAPFDGHPTYYPEIQPGAFDAGMARVLAEQESEPRYIRTSGLAEQVETSFMYGRRLTGVVSDIENGELDDAHDTLRDDAAVLFRAGWVMGCEAMELKCQIWRAERAAQSEGRCA